MVKQQTGKLISALVSGLVFGLGMAISGMTNTDRVQGFLDLFGQWDPTLAFVMGGGLVVAFIGYKLVLKNPTPLFADSFSLPTKTVIDKPLWIGAILFGVGWGLVGYCPGPAIAGLSYGYTATLLFVPTMIAGLLLAKPIAKLI
ncbi:MAG: YeeE/YedE family protein [Porticoccaceae bacterium]|nr:YeeE/YedE family protein [Porticoccaceae bacterium]